MNFSIDHSREWRAIRVVALIGLLSMLWACGAKEKIEPEPEGGLWTWVSGSSEFSEAGRYGILGVPNAQNVPGARVFSVSWSDSQGRFWLFGGDGWDSTGTIGTLNDLWMYDPSSSQWTWVGGSDIGYQPGIYGTKGLASPSNIPGARFGAESWVDASGRFWLFGGIGYVGLGEFGELNDLWRYDPASNLWTWVSGSDDLYQPGSYGIQGTAAPSNQPGARWEAASWVDPHGDFWLFGGSGYDSVGYYASVLNDLWRFDAETLEWTWVAGSNTMEALANYGTKGQAATTNMPGGRCGSASWVGQGGTLWLYGGEGWIDDVGDNVSLLNDLWKFDPASLEWTWVAGSASHGQPGVYGAKGTPDALNIPGARRYTSSWIDANGGVWLFGGGGYYAAQKDDLLNDLWRFDRTTLEWTWISGSKAGQQAGIYGEKGTGNPANVPGGRNCAVAWIDGHGDLWLFGGYGYDRTGTRSYLNDLWRFSR